MVIKIGSKNENMTIDSTMQRSHNRTVGKSRKSFRFFPAHNRMNTVVSPFTPFLPDVEPAGDTEALTTGAIPVHLDELIHELRQPLGVIESLTHFIELTTTDDKIRPRLEHIQSMLEKVHGMLENASEQGMSEWPAHLRHDRG